MHLQSIGSIVAVVGLMALLMPTSQAADQLLRIVNGQPINITQAPYTVQLRQMGQQFCGGTMVRPQYVVTAAHCFDVTHFSQVTVVGGASTIADVGQQRSIVGFIKPPHYTSQNMHTDVAILKLNSPMVVGNTVKTVPLCSKPMMAGQRIQVSGWGKMIHGGPGSYTLRTVSLPLISGSECQQRHATSGIPITDTMICALHPNALDSCHGDSGGPGIYGSELCGIVSWGLRCAGGAPSVYTNVYAMRPYIESCIASMEN